MSFSEKYPFENYSAERIKDAYLIVHPKILSRYNITRKDFFRYLKWDQISLDFLVQLLMHFEMSIGIVRDIIWRSAFLRDVLKQK